MMTVEEAERVRWQTCDRKTPYPDLVSGIERMRQYRNRRAPGRPGIQVHVYRCPFSGADEHYHFGHRISVVQLHRLALAMRTLGAGLGPTADQKASR